MFGWFFFRSTAERVEACSLIGGIPSAAQFPAVGSPTCGWLAVAHFTSNANAPLNWCSCLSPVRPAARNCWPAMLSARRRHRNGEPDPTRYRFFPARLGSICGEPFEGEIGSDNTNGVTSATARQHHSKAAARSRREQKGSNTMAYQTVNPYDNQVVATFDDLTDQQAMELLGQAQKTFESWSQTSFAERAAVSGVPRRSCASGPTSLPGC